MNEGIRVLAENVKGFQGIPLKYGSVVGETRPRHQKQASGVDDINVAFNCQILRLKMRARMNYESKKELSLIIFNKEIDYLCDSEIETLSDVISFCERKALEAFKKYKRDTWFSIGAY